MLPSNALREEPLWWNVISVPFVVFCDWLANGVASQNRGWKTLARALILTYTGMRPSQLMRLDVGTHISPYLNQQPPMVYVPAGKGGKPHWKPLTPAGVAAFRLFINSGAQGKFSTSAFYKSWMLACDEAQVARFHPYKLRHSYATLMRRAGVDVADIQETSRSQIVKDHRAIRDGHSRKVGRGDQRLSASLE